MNRKLFYIVLLLYALVIRNEICFAQEHFSYTYNTRNGLVSNKVLAVTEDENGNIWIPSDKGITKFNGERFKTFSINDGLPANETFFSTAINDKVWVYDNTPNITYIWKDTVYNHPIESSAYYRRTVTYHKRYYRGLGGVVTNTEAQNLTMLVSAYGINRSVRVLDFINKMPNLKQHIPERLLNYDSLLLNASVSIDSRLFVFAYLDSLIVYDLYAHSVKKTNTGALINRNIITKGVQPQIFSRYYMFVSDSAHVLRFVDLNDLSKKQIDIRHYDKSYRNAITYLIEGEKLGVTSTGNFYIVIDGDLTVVDTFSWDNRQGVNSINRDRSGNYWVATNNEGLNVVTRPMSKFKKINIDINAGRILNVFFHNGRYFLFDDKSNLFITDSLFRLKKQIKLPVVYKSYPTISRYWFFPDKKGGYYIASAFGAYYLNDRGHLGLVKVKKSETSCKDYNYDFASGKMVVGAGVGLLSLNANSNSIQQCDTSRQNRIMNVNQVGQEYLCTNDAGEIMFFDEYGKFKESVNVKMRIVFSTVLNNELFLATEGYGVFRYDKNTKQVEKVIDDKGFYYYKKSKNGFWAANDRYIVLFDNQLKVKKKYLNTQWVLYDELYNINECPSANFLLCDKGMIQLPDSTFTYYDKGFDESVHVSDISIGDSKYHFYKTDSVYSCDYSAASYKINISSNSTSYLGSVKYSYFIEELDRHWVDLESSSINFTRLAPGTYTFHLKASVNDLDLEAREKVFVLKVCPLWWQSVYTKMVGGLLVVLMIAIAVRMRLRSVKQQADEKNALDKKVAELELTALQSQMNPHFIFNSLTSIQSFINTHNVDDANALLQKFSLLVRLYLDFSKAKEITLQQELDALKLYIEIETIRFKDKFDVQFVENNSSSTSFKEIKVSPMLVQPLVENAINHGLYHLTDRKGILKLEVLVNDDDMKILVDDNGVGREAAIKLRSKLFPSVGNSLINDRIDVLNQSEEGKVSMKVNDKMSTSGEALGTRVVLTYKINEI